MSLFRELTDQQRRHGWLVSHTREDGVLEIPLTDAESKNALLRHWATGNGRFLVEEYTADGKRQPPQGDAWEPAPITWKEWVKP